MVLLMVMVMWDMWGTYVAHMWGINVADVLKFTRASYCMITFCVWVSVCFAPKIKMSDEARAAKSINSIRLDSSFHPHSQTLSLHSHRTTMASTQAPVPVAVAVHQLMVVYGGELAADIADQILKKKPANNTMTVSKRCADERPKTLLELDAGTNVCFVLQTIENGAPTEDVSAYTYIYIYIYIHLVGACRYAYSTLYYWPISRTS